MKLDNLVLLGFLLPRQTCLVDKFDSWYRTKFVRYFLNASQCMSKLMKITY